MGLLQQQNILARLYTDEDFRRQFLSEPETVGREYELDVSETAELAAIMPEEMKFFAESLFWKRLREVEKLLPLTRAMLAQDFAPEFRSFAQTFNPRAVKKHLEDAGEFCHFLERRPTVPELAREAAKFERARLDFFAFGKRIVVRRLKYKAQDLLQADRKCDRTLPRRTNFVVWIKIGNKSKHFNF